MQTVFLLCSTRMSSLEKILEHALRARQIKHGLTPMVLAIPIKIDKVEAFFYCIFLFLLL